MGTEYRGENESRKTAREDVQRRSAAKKRRKKPINQ
jgi:hypothetical protein